MNWQMMHIANHFLLTSFDIHFNIEKATNNTNNNEKNDVGFFFKPNTFGDRYVQSFMFCAIFFQTHVGINQDMVVNNDKSK